MPDWRIYHPSGVFTDPSEREQLSQALTSIYTGIGLPAFYVVVIFIEMPPATLYRGGVPVVSIASISMLVKVLIVSAG